MAFLCGVVTAAWTQQVPGGHVCLSPSLPGVTSRRCFILARAAVRRAGLCARSWLAVAALFACTAAASIQDWRLRIRTAGALYLDDALDGRILAGGRGLPPARGLPCLVARRARAALHRSDLFCTLPLRHRFVPSAGASSRLRASRACFLHREQRVDRRCYHLQLLVPTALRRCALF